MDWYYVDQQKRFGPVNEEEFRTLVTRGVIQAGTLVWNATLKGWEEYRKIQTPGAQASPMDASPATNADLSFCSECGRPYPSKEMLTYGRLMICAACKPVFVQKLKEGLYFSGSIQYAGFWIRFGAKIIDGLILSVVNMVVIIPISLLGVMPMTRLQDPSPRSIISFFLIQGIIMFLQVAIAAGYHIWLVGKYGATLGKMACGLKVVTAEGEKVTYLKALGRHFAEWITYLTCGVGYIMAAFDDQKRSLHDRICDTRVIKK